MLSGGSQMIEFCLMVEFHQGGLLATRLTCLVLIVVAKSTLYLARILLYILLLFFYKIKQTRCLRIAPVEGISETFETQFFLL